MEERVACFAFERQTANDLAFKVGDTIVVTNKSTGDDGWWEGYLKSDPTCKVGYFPENYALLPDAVPAVSEPATAARVSTDDPDGTLAAALDRLDPATAADRRPIATPEPMTIPSLVEFGELNEAMDAHVADALASPTLSSPPASTSPATSPATASTPAPVATELSLQDEPSSSGHCAIDARYEWREVEPYFEIEVDVALARGSKFGGLKKFTSYSIRTPAKGWAVLHRYKHFHWLRERLVAKYAGIAIPEIPSKQLTGRFKDNIVSYRRHFLAVFLNAVARHPVLRSAPVFHHFLSVDSTSEGEWKQGKRAAERDDVQGKAFLSAVSAAATPSLSSGEEVDQAQDFVRAMPNHAKHWTALVDVMNASAKKRLELVESTEELWQGFSQMSGSTGDPFCWRAECDECSSATGCLGAVSATLQTQAQLQLEASLAESDLANCFQSSRDALGVTLAAVKTEVSSRTAAVAKNAKLQAASQPVPEGSVEAAQAHLAVAVAELNHFHATRAIDNKLALLAYARTQAALHARAAASWTALAGELDAYPVDQAAYDIEYAHFTKLHASDTAEPVLSPSVEPSSPPPPVVAAP
ncbi:uncharacterized protein AMSG_00769 [Thecamonas trahens ATCC 50062]|uniref:Sorting nexin n=1 Tax=Thecamonas trahens ATCC 50062 TaxID=461836 RepID=A0A0L0DH27_THETB|nr:hypothetical protein AMSG_00769 [Thecamonas trahens ATCC 50062]KNC50608.1 hypothetical protein AMSG_00769 [Thecamonas trahens ATCC 50062]|eukprot:XP_013762495.1 hypothetical protein AMSG_00769 [Thecamonas trahens ATCC 50062]